MIRIYTAAEQLKRQELRNQTMPMSLFNRIALRLPQAAKGVPNGLE